MARPDPSAVSPNIWTDFEDDGLLTPKIGEQSRHKHQLLAYYLHVFANAMSKNFPHLVYVDLFAGAGRARIGRAGEIVEGSPLIACRTTPRFHKLILCEADPKNAAALERRIETEFPFLSYRVIPKNCNDAIDEIERQLPEKKGSLTVCFIDPFNLGIHMKTIRRLSTRYIDFVTLIADRMAGSRNMDRLVLPSDETVDLFLGDPGWRPRWKSAKGRAVSFHDFLFDSFVEGMTSMGFKTATPERVNVKNMGVGLYRLALSSKSDLALKIWESACRKAPDQPRMF